MSLENLKKEVSLLSYITDQGGQVKNIGIGKYRLDPCPVCGHKEHFTIYPETNTYSSFSECCKGGSIIDYFIEVEKMPLNEAISKLEGLYQQGGGSGQAPDKAVDKPVNKADYSELIDSAVDDPTGYFTGRGLSEVVIAQYLLGYLPDGYKGFTDGSRYKYIIPVSDSFVTFRADDNTGAKYKNLGSTEIFNLHYLTDSTIEEVYITEGVIDALSIETVDRPAIALNSASMAAELASILTENADVIRGKVLVLAIENDQAGQKVKKQIKEAADSNGIRCIELPLDGYHDPNDYLMKNRAGFEHAIDNLHFRRSIYTYLMDDFELDQKKRLEEKKISTGFAKLDEELGGSIYPGLYLLGSVPSLGKTALALQIAESIAAQQQDVLFFSLEMSRYELVGRSISRMLFQNEYQISTGCILNSSYQGKDVYSLPGYHEALARVKETFARYLTIEEGDFVVNMCSVEERVKGFLYDTGRKPIVIIDYLQIIAPPEGARLTDKQHVDAVIVALKRLSREIDSTVLGISSFNRDGYSSPVSFKSFKESGGLDYCADLVMGLQLRGNPSEDDANELKNQEPRPLELVILKNRRGRAYAKFELDFWPRFNHFDLI